MNEAHDPRAAIGGGSLRVASVVLAAGVRPRARSSAYRRRRGWRRRERHGNRQWRRRGGRRRRARKRTAEKGGSAGAGSAFKAVVTYPNTPYSNVASAQVTLPHSEFLDNAHIKTVCTRVQFAEGNVPGEKCPADSIYGKAKAITPILSEPLEGPVFLRSSSHQLPDLVAALHNNQVDIALDGHVEGVHGGIRNTFEAVPDAPVTQFTLEMQGGGKGLLENSTNLCARPHRATANFVGHNGKVDDFRPLLAVSCGKKGKHRKRTRH